MSRLNDQTSPELNKLVKLLTNKTEREQREVLLLISRRVLQLNNISDPKVEAGLNFLEHGKYGDSPEREEIKILTEELDEIAWDIQDQEEAAAVHKDEYLKAFCKARAVNALWFALDRDFSKAVSESIYEANAAMRDIYELEKIIEMNMME